MEFVPGKFNQPECRVADGRALSDLVDEQNASRADAPTAHPQLDRLIRTIWRLRQPDGCPWDREQTHASITKNMVEEAYEAVDAIDAHDDGPSVRGARRCPRAGASFTRRSPRTPASSTSTTSPAASTKSSSAATPMCSVILPPSVDGAVPAGYDEARPDGTAPDAPAVLDIWDDVKRLEREARGELSGAEAGLLDSVPASLPALMQAQKISKRAAKAGFEWETTADVWDKVAEERAEFEAEEPGSDAAALEFGDLLFALVNVARKEGIDAEEALAASNRKFRRRWARIEEAARAEGSSVEELGTAELNDLWERAKAEEKASR